MEFENDDAKLALELSNHLLNEFYNFVEKKVGKVSDEGIKWPVMGVDAFHAKIVTMGLMVSVSDKDVMDYLGKHYEGLANGAAALVRKARLSLNNGGVH